MLRLGLIMAGGDRGRVKEERRARCRLDFVACTGFVASALRNRFLGDLITILKPSFFLVKMIICSKEKER